MESKMIKIEAITLEDAYKDAASEFNCSITELNVEVVQHPSGGFLGLFKKKAIIVAVRKVQEQEKQEPPQEEVKEEVKEEVVVPKEVEKKSKPKKPNKKAPKKQEKKEKEESHRILNDTIMPQSFVSDQDDDDYELGSGLEFTADYDDAFDENNGIDEEVQGVANIDDIAHEVALEINKLFDLTCFNIETIEVSVYDNETLLLEFKGEDAALLIGKEGYRYKALSYMLFNWLNSKYQVQLRLEIAEFLKNQEESVTRYLATVYENVDRDGRAQTKILDGVLVQIALKELRSRYRDKYVAIRSTRDGLKYIIINEYNNY
jgi:spoIIIJ-associated protein